LSGNSPRFHHEALLLFQTEPSPATSQYALDLPGYLFKKIETTREKLKNFSNIPLLLFSVSLSSITLKSPLQILLQIQ
jgi:hypothetical protein